MKKKPTVVHKLLDAALLRAFDTAWDAALKWTWASQAKTKDNAWKAFLARERRRK